MTLQEIMSLVDLAAQDSPDPSTKIGAVLLTTNNKSIMSCNTFPPGVEPLLARLERPDKYLFIEHAERFAILAGANQNYPTRGSTLATTGIPCADCARACIVAGIATVITWEKGSGLENRPPAPGKMDWQASIKAGETMLLEAGVEIIQVGRS